MRISNEGASALYENGIRTTKAKVARKTEDTELQKEIAESEKDIGILVNLARNENLSKEAETVLIDRKIPRVNKALLESSKGN